MTQTNDRPAVIHLLPELEQGGVENHVIALANAQAAAGARVVVISAGGRLVASLSHDVEHIALPVGEKNFFTGIACARRVASIARARNIRILHAHSRVPAWVAYFAKKFFSSLKFVYTAHAMFSKNFGTWPIGRADAVICVSRSVRDDLEYRVCRVPMVRVIYNALPSEVVPWRGSGGRTKHILYAGRLTSIKNLDVVLAALAKLKDEDWLLDVCGDGKRDEYESLASELDISDKVIFHGAVDDIPERMASCDLFVMPSRREGLGLSLLEALSAGTPTLASDTLAAHEITTGGQLLPANDADAWTRALGAYLNGDRPATRMNVRLPTNDELARNVAEVYGEALRG